MKFQIGCKGTIFYAHSQKKKKKTDFMCTKHDFCAIFISMVGFIVVYV